MTGGLTDAFPLSASDVFRVTVERLGSFTVTCRAG